MLPFRSIVPKVPRGTPLRSVLVRACSTLAAKNLETTKISSPRDKPDLDSLMFGSTFTDHMLRADWVKGSGWSTPTIKPLENFSLHPACTVFHYAVECFEGMKAYKDSNGTVRLFRPDKNMERLANSGRRLMLPDFDGKELLELIKALVRLDGDWVPQRQGYSLYLRPTFMATTPALGVGPASHAMMFCICSPVGPYYPTGFNPVKVKAVSKHVRAWPGGTGNAKIGSNYGPTIRPQVDAAGEGYQQVLWLFGEEEQVTEVGTMNQFFFMKTKDGEPELRTAPLDGTILPGVTRDSILSLAREWGEFKVSEKAVTMPELVEAIEQGRVIEAFGAGTACVVCPVNGIGYNGKDYDVPLGGETSIGPLTKRFLDELTDIQYGVKEHPWSVPL